MQSLKSLWKQWHHLIVLGGFTVSFVVFFQFWARYQGDLPVVPVHSSYLEYLSKYSPKAREYMETYFREQGRASVASKHFEHVCAAMTRLAVEDEYTPNEYPEVPGPWCYERSAYYSELLQPR
jgi:hypothetical protein